MLLVNRRSLAGFCAAGAIALVAGCGGGGDDTSSGALSAGEFRTQADAICQTSKDAIAALDQPTASSTGAQITAFLTASAKTGDAEIAKLRALDPPADLAGSVDQALDLLEQRQTRLRAVLDRVAAGEDLTKVVAQENAQIESLNNQADAKARELGLTVCGTDDADSGASTTSSAATTPTAPTTTTGGTTSAQLATDLRAVQARVLAVAQTLQTAGGSLDDLKAAVPGVRANLADFDQAVAKVAGDTSSDPALEKTRVAVAAAGPKVSDAFGRLLDALENGDEAATTALLPELEKALGELQTAFTG